MTEKIVLPAYDQARFDHMQYDMATCKSCGETKMKQYFQIRKHRQNRRGETAPRWTFACDTSCKRCVNAEKRKLTAKNRTGNCGRDNNNKTDLLHVGPVDPVERLFFCTLPVTPLSVELRSEGVGCD